MTDAVTLYVTCADIGEAERIADALVTERLAACANILGEMRSVYRWQGKIARDHEVAMLVKTTRDRTDAATARIVGLHSYDTPCVVAWPIISGAADYLAWIEAETGEGG